MKGQGRGGPPARSAAGGLLVVLVIGLVLLTISLGVAIPSARHDVTRKKEDELRFILGEFRRAIGKFQSVHHRPPSTIAEMLADADGTPFLRKLYADPFTGRSDWLLESQGDSAFVRSVSSGTSLSGTPYSEFR